MPTLERRYSASCLASGPTTGAVLHAAQAWGKDNPGRAVVISGDSAAKYVESYADYL